MERIFRRVAAILKRKGFGELSVPRWADAAEAPGRRGAPLVPAAAEPLVSRVGQLLQQTGEERRSAAVPVFFDELCRLLPIRAGYAALFLAGLDAPQADQLREAMIETEPAL